MISPPGMRGKGIGSPDRPVVPVVPRPRYPLDSLATSVARAVQDHSMVLARLPRAWGHTRVEALLSRCGTYISPQGVSGEPLRCRKPGSYASLARRFSGNFESRSLRNCRREMPRRGSFVRYPLAGRRYAGSGAFPWQRVRCSLLPAQACKHVAHPSKAVRRPLHDALLFSCPSFASVPPPTDQ